MRTVRRVATATIIAIVALSIIAIGAIDIDSYKPPAPHTILETIRGRAAFPSAVLSEKDLPFLDCFPGFSLGVLLALETRMPITSWTQLRGATYQSVNKERGEDDLMHWVYGADRKLMTTGIALILYTFYELEGLFPFLY